MRYCSLRITWPQVMHVEPQGVRSPESLLTRPQRFQSMHAGPEISLPKSLLLPTYVVLFSLPGGPTWKMLLYWVTLSCCMCVLNDKAHHVFHLCLDSWNSPSLTCGSSLVAVAQEGTSFLLLSMYSIYPDLFTN